MSSQRTIDPITLEIWWSRLVAIADEAATTLVRTAFSTIIRESNDYSVVLLNSTAPVRRSPSVAPEFQIEVALPGGILDSAAEDGLREAFKNAYAGLFEQAVEDAPVEVINWRLSVRLPGRTISLAYTSAATPAKRGERMIHFAGFGDRPTAVYDRYALRPGTIIPGPAAFEERESTFIAGPDCTVTVDDHWNLVAAIASDNQNSRAALSRDAAFGQIGA